ncbi:MAG: EAL domain-containing protein [Gammaproteobacteria bacterium]|nr:EAL domain-containing protein [Gammaproteobacteria bacterium]
MARRSLRQRLIVLLVAALGAVQILTLSAVLLATHRNVRFELHNRLGVAEDVFERLYESRFRQLLASVEVLSSDFGFKQAAASADRATIASALENHGARAGADVALLVALDGQMVASNDAQASLADNPTWQALLGQLRRDDTLLATVTLDRAAYQLVATPVRAPEKIGWLLLGFAVNDTLAAELRHLTGLEVSFVTRSPRPHLLASTLSDVARGALLAASPVSTVAGKSPVGELSLNGERYIGRTLALASADPHVDVLLQQSLSAALLPYHRLAWRLAAFFTLVLALAIAAGVSVARSVTAPLQQLAGAAARIGEGQYGSEVEVQSDDEIGQLAATINGMQFEIAEREHRIVHQAHHDDLTGLPNRWLANDRLNGAIHRAQRSARPFSVALLDLSRFKQINDSLGHHVGDVVLKETARRIVARARRADTVARLGGDDFLLVLEGADIQQARAILSVLRSSLTQPIELEGMSVSLDFRAGVASYPEHGEDPSSLMRRAEIAMYDAKDSQEWLVPYRAGRDEGHLRQLAIVATLPAALARDELTLHYQAKADMGSGLIAQAEALVRWVHPQFGFLPPDEFITVIEQSGNIAMLTAWIIDRAARQCREWLSQGLDIKVSVNLSALDLLNDELPALLERCLHQYQLSPRQLGLEVTESAVMRDPASALAVLARLRETGFGLSIDDFGTGYSSLAQLKRMPVDELKIDKSFVLHLNESSDDRVIVKSTIDLAHTLGLKVVAEGVETVDAWHCLRQLGCDVAQGYLIAKPLAPAEFERFLRANGQSCVTLTEAAA